MAASYDDIKRWLYVGNTGKNSHMIVVCDTYDWDDYTVHVLKDENIWEKIEHYNGRNMQKIMEIYNYNLDLEEQLNQGRAYNIEPVSYSKTICKK